MHRKKTNGEQSAFLVARHLIAGDESRVSRFIAAPGVLGQKSRNVWD
jgi:hypothetical protein